MLGSAPDDPQAMPDAPSDCVAAQCLSDDGRFLALRSTATNMVDGDTNRAVDVFVRDLSLRTTTRVSVSSDGSRSRPDADAAGLGSTAAGVGYPHVAISKDGRYVTFASNADDLVVYARLRPPA